MDSDENHLEAEKLDDLSSLPTTPISEAAKEFPITPTRSRRPSMSTKSSSARVSPQASRGSDDDKPKQKWTTKRVLKICWDYVTTIKVHPSSWDAANFQGFLITVYMLNVIAWGGMLFLLLINAAPAMCNPNCYDDYSPKKICTSCSTIKLINPGIEIDMQILNALFCVTGFGLLPWRLRDGWHLVRGNWERLSEIHSGWYIDGVTKRKLMWWVVILFLNNSLWQIVVCPFL